MLMCYLTGLDVLIVTWVVTYNYTLCKRVANAVTCLCICIARLSLLLLKMSSVANSLVLAQMYFQYYFTDIM